MNIFELHDVCKEILHDDVQCQTFQHACTTIKDSSNKLTGYMWRCPRKKQSLLKDSYLEKAKISPRKFLFIVYY